VCVRVRGAHCMCQRVVLCVRAAAHTAASKVRATAAQPSSAATNHIPRLHTSR
jgi:hypothetical protein